MKLLSAIVAASAALVCSTAPAVAGAAPVPPARRIISNVAPRRDTRGDIVNAHDGQIIREAGTWYWFAAGYLACKEYPGLGGCAGCAGKPIGPACGCGFEPQTAVNLYTSDDLVTWTPHGDVLEMASRPHNTSLFSPRVLYNDATETWVMWYNFVPKYSYAVATSKSPFGPFKTVSTTAGASFKWGQHGACASFGRGRPNTCLGDFSLFKDDDGAGYMLYSHDPGPTAAAGVSGKLSVARLTPDFTASAWDKQTGAGEEALELTGWEAPAMFKFGGWYYALTSAACCYCGGGGTVFVHRARSPLGPYETQAAPISFGNGTSTRTQGQQTTVTTLPSGALVWQGDRWQTAPDRLKAHDFQFWTCLSISDDGWIAPMAWVDEFDLEDCHQIDGR